MWVAEHASWCSDKSQYLVIETVRQIQNRHGDCVQDFHLAPQRVRTKCAHCGAKARWFRPADDYWDTHEGELVALSSKEPR